MSVERHFLIYGLIDPETKLLRYVGKSSVGIRRAHQKHSAHCENWRQELKTRGLKPEVIIIEDLNQDGSMLNEREMFWIGQHRQAGAPLTNLTVGGDGYVLTPEHRMKLLVANLGRACSTETRAKISAANKGRKRTPEQRERNAEAHRGFKASEETKAKMSQTRKGRALSDAHIEALKTTWHEHHDEKTFEKIAASKRGKPRDAATREKLSTSLKGKPWSEARRKAHEHHITMRSGRASSCHGA